MTEKLRILKQMFGGDLCGRTLLHPTLGHSPRDRGTSITDDPSAPGGLLVNVYNGSQSDALAAKDRALQALGVPTDHWRNKDRPEDPAEEARRLKVRRQAEANARADAARRQRRALAIWHDTQVSLNTIVQIYLASRGLDLPEDIATNVLRYHPHCPWETGTVPAMVAALRCVRTGEITGVHRTALTPDGAKLGRKMLGLASGAAVMLDAKDTVSAGLTVGEGVESCMSARQLGLRPTWALGSTANIAAFPVLPGIETLTLLGELGDGGASARACAEVGERWQAAGRAIDLIRPNIGNDMNDALLGRSAA